MSNQRIVRKSAGTSAGGQFARTSRAESGLELEHYRHLLGDARPPAPKMLPLKDYPADRPFVVAPSGTTAFYVDRFHSVLNREPAVYAAYAAKGRWKRQPIGYLASAIVDDPEVSALAAQQLKLSAADREALASFAQQQIADPPDAAEAAEQQAAEQQATDRKTARYDRLRSLFSGRA